MKAPFPNGRRRCRSPLVSNRKNWGSSDWASGRRILALGKGKATTENARHTHSSGPRAARNRNKVETKVPPYGELSNAHKFFRFIDPTPSSTVPWDGVFNVTSLYESHTLLCLCVDVSLVFFLQCFLLFRLVERHF